MKVLVTGGAGFIGVHLVAALAAAGDEVVVLDNMYRGSRQAAEHAGASHIVEGDIRTQEVVRAALHGCERIYHLAAQSNVLGAIADVEYSFSTNVVGTYNVLVAARDASVERVIFTSSREVYGEVQELPVAEDRPRLPKNAYGASKVAGEVYCQVFQTTYGLDVSVLRLANVYGLGDRDRVLPIWLERARQGQDLQLYGGQQVIDFVPVDLVVQALRIVAARQLRGQPVNVGSGSGTSLRDVASRIQALPGVSSGMQILPARTAEVTHFIADIGRMRTLLGLTPPEDPLSGLRALWEAL